MNTPSHTWYKQLGFSKYPLDPRSNPQLVGVDDIERQILDYITQGNMCLLSGFTGSGKTSMLLRLMKHPQLAQYQFIFISADGIKRDYDISDAFSDSQSFVDKLLFKKPRNVVVLLDESHLANRILTESIKSKWNYVYPDGMKMIQSVIVSQIEPQLGTNFSGSFMDRLGKRILQMKRLDVTDLAQVLKIRLETTTKNYVDVFDQDALELLCKSADGSVRQLLEYTDAVFRQLCSMNPNPLLTDSFKVEKSAIFNLLQQSGLAVDEKSMLAKKGHFEKVLGTKRLKNAIEMYEQFGTLSAELLAEKLDVTKRTSVEIIGELEQADCLIYSHTDNDQRFYVLTPRLKHQIVKQ
jgi:DNA-binding MarR family transcriptional regulator